MGTGVELECECGRWVSAGDGEVRCPDCDALFAVTVTRIGPAER